MKRIIIILLAASALLFTASCQQERLEPVAALGNAGTVSITLELDGTPLSKADGETSAMNVYYEIYDTDFSTRLYPAADDGIYPTAEMTNKVEVKDSKATITAELLKGKEYGFVFWAMENDSPYTWTTLSDISLNYGSTGNENREAFYGSIKVKGGESAKVTLVRPFAQLNFGAKKNEMVADDPTTTAENDPAIETCWNADVKEYYPYNGATIAVTGTIADTFNAITSDASDSENSDGRTFASQTLYGSVDGNYLVLSSTDADATADREEYIHVSMDYIMPTSSAAAGLSTTVTVKATFKAGENEIVHTLENVPLKGNYRTNIVGNLFTGEGDLTVDLAPWSDSDTNIDLWDGSAEEVTPEENVYIIETVEQLAWVAEQVNSGANDFNGQTIRLAADISLAGSNWTPIGAAEGDVKSPYAFRGTFDGAKETAVKSGSTECYTISDMTVDVQDKGAGLFGLVQGGTVRNLNLNKVSITNTDRDGGSYMFSGSGAAVGTATYGAIIENVHVYDCTISSNHYVGGIAGYLAGRIADCTVVNYSLTAVPDCYTGVYDNGDKIGGILGYQQGPGNSSIENEITGCQAVNGTIEGTRDMAGIVGFAHKTPTKCHVDGLSITVDQSLLPEAKAVNANAVTGRKAEKNYTEITDAGNTYDAENLSIRQTVADGVQLDLLAEGSAPYMILDVAGLYWLAEQVNTKGNTFSGQTIILENDIDLKNAAWTPIGQKGAPFCGTFKGLEETTTVSNFTVESDAFAGLFGNSTSGRFENFTVSGATIISNHYAGAVVGFTQGLGHIRNVHVKTSAVTALPELIDDRYDNGDKAGSVAGYVSFDAGSGDLRVEDCSVEDVIVTAYRDAGGLVGAINGTNSYVGGNSLKNVTVTVNRELDHPYIDDSAAYAGEIVGRNVNNGTIADDNTTDNVKVTVNHSFAELLSIENAIVSLSEGTYRIPAELAKGVTIECAAGTELQTPEVIKAENFTIKGAKFDQTIEDSHEYGSFRFIGSGTLENCELTGECCIYQGHGEEYATGQVTLKNCKITADWAYAVNISGDADVLIDNCEIIGWNSFGVTGKVTIKNTRFDDNGTYGKLRFYQAAEVSGCTFNDGMSIDFDNPYMGSIDGKSLTFTDCRMSDGGSIVDIIDMTCLDTCSPVLMVDGTRYVGTKTPVELTSEYTTAITNLDVTNTVNVSGTGNLLLDNLKITAAEGDAIALASGSEATVAIVDNVTLTGATGGNGIKVPSGATLSLVGDADATSDVLVVKGADASDDNTGGSGIGNAYGSTGNISISGLTLTAEGYGTHAYGIGGNGSTVTISNSTIDYARGGCPAATFITDMSYGKSEKEGAPAIGGAVININGSTVTKAEGGSKAAAIGAQFHNGVEIKIVSSTLTGIQGGNASAGIGGSRYAKTSTKHNIRIEIENSTITAAGGQYGAGIGSGYDTHCGQDEDNTQVYGAENSISIKGNSNITATGGMYAAGIGTGYHSAYLSGAIESTVTVNATSGEKYYKDAYTLAQDIGYGVVDPKREYSDSDANITFQYNGSVITAPSLGSTSNQ